MENYLNQYPAILTVKEVAEILCVSEPLVRDLVATNQINSLRVGRLIRIPKIQLINYINTCA